MSSLIDLLGLDVDDLVWQDLAICTSMPVEYYYERYESSESTARLVDQACLSCPVIRQCLFEGVENKEWGVWGGVFLINGKMDQSRNSHKTDEVWQELRGRVGHILR